MSLTINPNMMATYTTNETSDASSSAATASQDTSSGLRQIQRAEIKSLSPDSGQAAASAPEQQTGSLVNTSDAGPSPLQTQAQMGMQPFDLATSNSSALKMMEGLKNSIDLGSSGIPGGASLMASQALIAPLNTSSPSPMAGMAELSPRAATALSQGQGPGLLDQVVPSASQNPTLNAGSPTLQGMAGRVDLLQPDNASAFASTLRDSGQLAMDSASNTEDMLARLIRGVG